MDVLRVKYLSILLVGVFVFNENINSECCCKKRNCNSQQLFGSNHGCKKKPEVEKEIKAEEDKTKTEVKPEHEVKPNPRPEVKPESEVKPNTNPNPKPNPNVFKSIKIKKCTITDIKKTFNCKDITKNAYNSKFLFENVIDNVTVYENSARLFLLYGNNGRLLVFTKDIKDKIKDNKTSSKVCEISEGVHCLYVYYLGDKTNYGVIYNVKQDDKNQNSFNVECGKGI